jgi:hypothetical protein
MSKHLKPETPASSTLQVGERVVRKSSVERGTVVEVDGKVKVKWDKGSTSYYRRGEQGNVRRPLSSNE